MAALRFFMGVCGNVTALSLYLAPSITIKRIIKSKSTGKFSCVPYAMTVLNCLLYTWYGLPFVSANNLLISTINGTGATIEFVYVLIFTVYASKKDKARILGLLAFVISVIATVAFVSLFMVHGEDRKLLCGLAATIFCIVMYASPLSVMKVVIKTKSVEYMPFCLSMFIFLCSTSWFIYGLLGNDPFVFVSNGLGSGLGTMQLILYAIYRNGKVQSEMVLHDSSPFEMDLESQNVLHDGSLIEMDPKNVDQKNQQEEST